MKLITELATKKISDAKPGELVKVLVNKDYVFAIVLDVNTRRAMVGILSTANGASSAYDRISPDSACLSFGVDFAVEPILGEETRAGNSAHQTNSGVLFTAGSVFLICFQPARNDLRDIEVYFDLSNGKFEDTYPRELAAPFLKWNIWESREACKRPGNEPLIRVEAVQPK